MNNSNKQNPEITVSESDDCIHIDYTDDRPTLEESLQGTDIRVAGDTTRGDE